MKFKANVTMIDSKETQGQQTELTEVKKMFLQALGILAKSDANIINEAQDFLKKVNA